MSTVNLHLMAKQGDLANIRMLLEQGQFDGDALNARDARGWTPLMYAVSSPHGNAELVRLLLAHGANSKDVSTMSIDVGHDVMAMALQGGDPGRVRVLIEHGADVKTRSEHGYGALLHAVHGRDVLRDPRLPELLQLLIAHGAGLDDISTYAESALRVLSRVGRFDAVRLLLDAGADASQLRWTPLMQAVATGTLADIQRELEADNDLEAKDWWGRTAWLLAIMTGDIDKADCLRTRGADIHARGKIGQPPLFYAIETHHAGMLRWLLTLGLRVSTTDHDDCTPLMTAADADNLEAVDILLAAGADVRAGTPDGRTPLSYARSKAVAGRLLAADADSNELAFEARRALLGLPPTPDSNLLKVTTAEFHSGRLRRFGIQNPEEQNIPFWQGMIRSGISAYQAACLLGGRASLSESPVWCAERFGQSITFLPDGRIVQVAGEHEDSYDPDFCIYNDVFVHHPDGRIQIFGYPESVFPPTDFHTATLLGSHIYIIGSLGYYGTRKHGETPVYRLDTDSFRIERLETRGDNPGWISRHTAFLSDEDVIRIFGGKREIADGKERDYVDNTAAYELDTRTLRWARIESA